MAVSASLLCDTCRINRDSISTQMRTKSVDWMKQVSWCDTLIDCCSLRDMPNNAKYRLGTHIRMKKKTARLLNIKYNQILYLSIAGKKTYAGKFMSQYFVRLIKLQTQSLVCQFWCKI